MSGTIDPTRHPNPLAAHYRNFRVADRILLTGHSHQAWPDVAFDGQAQAIAAAADLVDDKWAQAFAAADQVRAGYRRLLDDPSGHYSLAASTHDLLVKLLSALPWRSRRRIVTSDREFYSLDRQLRRRNAGCRTADPAQASHGKSTQTRDAATDFGRRRHAVRRPGCHCGATGRRRGRRLQGGGLQEARQRLAQRLRRPGHCQLFAGPHRSGS